MLLFFLPFLFFFSFIIKLKVKWYHTLFSFIFYVKRKFKVRQYDSYDVYLGALLGYGIPSSDRIRVKRGRGILAFNDTVEQ